MATPSSWIKLNRNIMDWRWYRHPGVKALFLHLLLKAYIADGVYKDKEILRGQVPTTAPMLASELGMSVRSIRSYLDKLKKTGEIKSQSFHDFSIITVNNYELYQETPAVSDNNKSKKKGAKKKEKPTAPPPEDTNKYLPQWWELTIPQELWGRFGTEDEYWEYAAQGGEK